MQSMKLLCQSNDFICSQSCNACEFLTRVVSEISLLAFKAKLDRVDKLQKDRLTKFDYKEHCCLLVDGLDRK